jgi:hypothetical protein
MSNRPQFEPRIYTQEEALEMLSAIDSVTEIVEIFGYHSEGEYNKRWADNWLKNTHRLLSLAELPRDKTK